MNFPDDLRPGDILLYNSGSITDKIIEWKEGDPDTAHVEVYVGYGRSVASRNGIGVKDIYDFRPEGLVHVRRPCTRKCALIIGEIDSDLAPAMAWFETVRGAPYGWGDIGANAGLIEKPEDAWTKSELLMKSGMDCSHFASLFLLACSREQFDPAFDARRITPRDFKISPLSYAVWDYKRTNITPNDAYGVGAVAAVLSPRAAGEQIIHTD